MKNIFQELRSLLPIFVTALLVAAPASAQVWTWGTGGPVVVYDQRDGRGTSQGFDVGEYRNNRGELGRLGNDRASSVEVPDGYRVRFCDSEGRGNGSGRCEEFGPGYHNLRYQNSASYIQVTGPRGTGGWGGGGIGRQGVIVYEDRDARGRSQSFGIGRYLSGGGQFGSLRNDEASSVVVARGYRVRLCEHEGTLGIGDGRCEEYNEGTHNLRYNDEASYIEVRRAGAWGPSFPGPGPGPGPGPIFGRGVTVYEDRDYRGNSQSFGPGRYLAGAGQFGGLRNDEAGSVVVDRGYRVRLCENEGTQGIGSGRCEEYGEGRYNLRYNDEASYIEVTRMGGGFGGGDPTDGVMVYSERNQRGDSQWFGVGTYRNDLGQLGNIRNDDATSIFVPRNFRARICAGEGGGGGSGRCEEYGPGSYNLRYNDEMSFIRVWRTRF